MIETTKSQAAESVVSSTYNEIQIGKTLYRVTGVYLGQKDLCRTLEQLAVRKIYDEVTNEAKVKINT